MSATTTPGKITPEPTLKSAIHFTRTHDMDLVRRVFTDPEIYPGLTDDGCVPAENYEPQDNPSVLYVEVRISKRLAGLWMFVPSNSFCYEVHTAILPWARGRMAITAAKMMTEWIWANTPCVRIWTSVPAFNESAFWFAKQSGMQEFGCNSTSFVKNGLKYDQHLLGVSRPEEICQPS